MLFGSSFLSELGWFKEASSTGNGLPTGGTTGQILYKISGTDYDAGWESLDTSIVPENGNLYFTNERATDAVGAMFTDTSTIHFVFDDPNNLLTANVQNNSSRQKVGLSLNNTLQSARWDINLIEGSGIDINVADDNVNDQVDVTIGMSAFPPGYVLFADHSTGYPLTWPNTYVTTDYGLSVYEVVDLTTTTNSNFYRYEEALEISADTTNNHTMFSYDYHFDRDNTGFNTTGSVSAFNYSSKHEGNGAIASFRFMDASHTLGNESTTSYSDDFIFYNSYQHIGDTAQAYNVRGMVYSFDASGSGSVVNDYYAHGTFVNNVAIGNNIDGSVIYLSPTTVGGNLRGMVVSGNGDITGRVDGYSFYSDYNCEYLTGYSGNSNGVVDLDISIFNYNVGGNVGGNYQGVSQNIGNSVTVGGDVTMFSGYTSNTTVISGNSNIFNIGMEADFGQSLSLFNAYSNGDVTNNFTFINFSTQGSADFKNGLNMNFQGSATTGFKGIEINGTISSAQVVGANINLSQMTSSQQKQGVQINDGALFVTSNFDTSVLPASPGFFNLNNVGGNLHVASGNPTSNTLVFGNNFGISGKFDDDMGPDPFGGLVGFGMNAYVGQIAVASTKTVDNINVMLVAGQVTADSTGGTVSTTTMFNAVGFLPAGGSLVQDKVYAFRGQQFISSFATSAWGVHIDDANCENWFKKSLKIGGSAGSTDVVTNSDCTLEVEGGAVRLPNIDTSTRNALSALGGMLIYNTDTGGIEYYDDVGMSWVAV